MRPRILVSACLLGAPVRHNRKARTLRSEVLHRWLRDGYVVPLCPEVAAGMSTPREAAEIAAGFTADDVIEGTGRVITLSGKDVTQEFLRGAQIALDVANSRKCDFALLTDKSPSCGSTYVYSGRHDGRTRVGHGLVTAMLRQHGIQVFSENQVHELDAIVSR